MRYNEIAEMALAHMEFGTDDGTFTERFFIYINDAIRIIARSLKLENVDPVVLTDSHFNVSDLSKKHVTKIVEVSNGSRQYRFVRGNSLGDFVVSGCNESTVSVRYRWMPAYNTNGDAEPEIPEVFHPILYLYVVHCHHNTRSTSTDYDRTKWLQEFERERRQIARAYGAHDAYEWKNRPWETGEM